MGFRFRQRKRAGLSLVFQSDDGNRFWHCEDDVKVTAVEPFALAVGIPAGASQGLALGAVTVGTGIVVDAFVAAVVTAFGVAAASGAARASGRPPETTNTTLCQPGRY